MTGKYVLRGTGEPVRVLCVDAPDERQPVISMAADGTIRRHEVDGKCVYVPHRRALYPQMMTIADPPMDLIPAPPTPPVVTERGLYRMRNNRVIQVICTDCPGPKPIVCVTPRGDYAGHWAADGRRDDLPSEYDIVERIS